MVDRAGDIVGVKREGRIGTITKVKGNKATVRFTDTAQPQEITFKKEELYSVHEVGTSKYIAYDSPVIRIKGNGIMIRLRRRRCKIK